MPHIKKKTRNDERKKYNRLQLINCLESIFNESSSISICMYPVNWIEYVKSTCFPPPPIQIAVSPLPIFYLTSIELQSCAINSEEKKKGEKRNIFCQRQPCWRDGILPLDTHRLSFIFFGGVFFQFDESLTITLRQKKEFHSLDSIYWKSLF